MEGGRKQIGVAPWAHAVYGGVEQVVRQRGDTGEDASLDSSQR